ncbi:bifunctional diaminohydroxyphosphoribosylaminopyrimidine deaminase/5-amino-6-(5-phosphoribosylamino)uracil reductase RibD [Fervidobacterium sp.]
MDKYRVPNDEFYMKIALRLAKKGLGFVNPNPPVGAVIVKYGNIIGKGYHSRFGALHAEREALLDAKKRGFDVSGATMYVTLEPCDHYGKTPPCTDAIIESGIKRVVISARDPNPVSGDGIKKLMKNGIEVMVGVLENEAKEIAKFFFKYVTTDLPYVTLKYASTLDGKIADKIGNSKWITQELRREVHKLRDIHKAILVGAETVLKDNPMLNVRLPKRKFKNPDVVVLDENGRILKKVISDIDKFELFNPDYHRRVIIFSSNQYQNVELPGNVKVKTPASLSVENILKELAKEGIDSVLIEGGASVFSQFLPYADEIYGFYATKIFGKGKSIFEHLDVPVKESEIPFEIQKVKIAKNRKELMVVMRRCSQELFNTYAKDTLMVRG